MKFSKIKKLAFTLCFSLVIASLIFSGASCTSKKTSTGGQQTLTIWHLFEDESVFKPIIDSYQASNPNVKINFVKKDYNEYEEDSLNMLAQNEGPDIWLVRNDWMARHYKKLVPMTSGLLTSSDQKKRSDLEIFKDKFASVVSNDLVVNNQIYGLPLSVDTLALYYNTDIFKDKKTELYKQNKTTQGQLLENPPATWSDLINVSKLLTQTNGDQIIKSGIALGTSANIEQANDILYALMLQNHTKMVSDDKKSATFNLVLNKSTGEPVYPGTQALDFFTSFSNSGKETYSWSASMPGDFDAFVQGKTAMMINYSFKQKNIAQVNPNLNYSIAPLPQIPGETTAIDYASYWVETVTKKCAIPDVAWDFIRYLTFENLDGYLSASQRPSPYKQDINVEVNQRVQNKNQTFKFQANTAQSWFKGAYPLKVDKIFAELIDNISVYKQPSQTSLDAAAAKVTNLLK